MIRPIAIAAALVFAVATPALAAEARAEASVTIQDPAMLRLVWPAALPTVTGAADGARFVGRIPSMGMAMMMPANARLVIQREDETGANPTAPTAFEVVSAGPDRGYIVRTSYSADALQSLDGLIVGGDLTGSAAASIDVARNPAVASIRSLMVVVQYN
jgi:hypothetical protein